MAPIIEVKSTKLDDIKDKCLVIAFFEDKLGLRDELPAFDKGIGNIIGNSIKNKDFNGEESEVKIFYLNSKNLNSLALLGLGREDKFSLNRLMNSAGILSKKLRNSDVKSFSICLDSFNNKNFDQFVYLEKIAKAILLSIYQYTQFKTKDLDKVKAINKISIIVDSNISQCSSILMECLISSDAVNKTRDLVNTPPNIATPDYVAKYAKETAKKNRLKCTIIGDKQLEKLGMECFMGVGKGSINKPRMFVLEYNGNGNEKPIVLVGKGITFDTGGINVKPHSYMMTMKDDKAGACGVIHILEACAKLKLKVNAVGIGALAENMVDGSSYKPDDILKSYSGITVEIVHTDAEGRLVLADALSYAHKFNPKAIIDIATLTGASIIALGYFASPVLGNDQKLIDRIKAASEKSLEKVWQFPLWEEYEELIKSDIADIKHLSEDIGAGVMVGGIFLKNFIKDVPWAHIDIGNTVWAKQEKGYTVKGPTGFSVLLLLDLLKDWR